ncbi:GAF domain-containing protein [Thermogemmatispora sp.]|uniref:GAF domain-containing protein n=1 Tax=Thermogemmatispora sp. TaxID=1968838 RepID=UPI0035E42F4B
MSVSESPSWQSVLQRLIRTTPERQRLATALGVTSMTLSRWANGESRPHRSHLIRLVQAVHPQYRQELLEALRRSFPDIDALLRESAVEQVPAEFFAQVLNARTTTIESLRFWQIGEMVLRQALAQLDPNHLGMSITLIQCMPPHADGKIRSLRERMGKGTLPWTADLEQMALFLGMESLAGYVVESGRVQSIEDLRKYHLVPAYQSEFEISAAAHPIWLGGRVAGCLLASSTEVGYFSQQRMSLLAIFSDLASLAFDPSEFYSPSQIELRPMPSPEKQRPILATFRQRVARLQYQRHLSSAEAEQEAWREIEAELLRLGEQENETLLDP